MTILPPGRIFLCDRRFVHRLHTRKNHVKSPFAWRYFHSTRSRQHLSGGLKPTLRASPEFASLGGEPSICLAWQRAQRLPRLAASQYLPRLAANPAFISLGGKPSVYLAWRHFHSTRSRQHLSGGLKPALRASPEFASLGGESSVYLAWRLPIVRERATPTRWLKRCCSQQSAWVFFLRWVLFWQKETRVLRVPLFVLCCVFLSSDRQIYRNRNLP